MEILAITNSDPKRTSILELLEVATYLTSQELYETVVQGSITSSTSGSGSVLIYVSDYVSKVRWAFNDESKNDAPDVSLRNCQGYSLISIPYRFEESNCRFGVRMSLERRDGDSLDFETRIYVGTPGVHTPLTRQEVWNRLIPISALRFWLFYPRQIRLKSSQPKARSSRLASPRLQKLFSGDVDLDNWHLLEWEGQRISLTNPFVGGARFEKAHGKGKESDAPGLEDKLNLEVQTLTNHLKTLQDRFERELDLTRHQLTTFALRQRLFIGLFILTILVFLIIGFYSRLI